MKKILMILCLFAIFSACKKSDFKGTDTNIPDVPVTVSNLFGTYNGVPAVATSLSGSGVITITMTIPSSSGRTIKEITRVASTTTPTNYKAVEITSGLYNTAAIPGSGTSVTFTTSLTEYTAKTGAVQTASGTATSFLARYFMFMITLDNGDQIYPLGVRVYVNT